MGTKFKGDCGIFGKSGPVMRLGTWNSKLKKIKRVSCEISGRHGMAKAEDEPCN